jgi:hypothetical protein
MLSVTIAILIPALVAGQPAASVCTSTCLCNQGAAKTVPDVWPNATQVLCGQPPKTCEVCSTCNKDYPKCPCCNPLFATADSCLSCRVDGKNSAVCGNPQVTYSCDHKQSTCNVAEAGGVYPNKTACDTACQPSYNCQNTGKGDQCVAAPAGSPGTYPTLKKCYTSCKTPSTTSFECVAPSYQCKQEAGGRFNSSGGCKKACVLPKPTPSPPKPMPTPAPPKPSPSKPTPSLPCSGHAYCCGDGPKADCFHCHTPRCTEIKPNCGEVVHHTPAHHTPSTVRHTPYAIQYTL